MDYRSEVIDSLAIVKCGSMITCQSCEIREVMKCDHWDTIWLAWHKYGTKHRSTWRTFEHCCKTSITRS